MYSTRAQENENAAGNFNGVSDASSPNKQEYLKRLQNHFGKDSLTYRAWQILFNDKFKTLDAAASQLSNNHNIGIVTAEGHIRQALQAPSHLQPPEDMLGMRDLIFEQGQWHRIPPECSKDKNLLVTVDQIPEEKKLYYDMALRCHACSKLIKDVSVRLPELRLFSQLLSGKEHSRDHGLNLKEIERAKQKLSIICAAVDGGKGIAEIAEHFLLLRNSPESAIELKAALSVSNVETGGEIEGEEGIEDLCLEEMAKANRQRYAQNLRESKSHLQSLYRDSLGVKVTLAEGTYSSKQEEMMGRLGTEPSPVTKHFAEKRILGEPNERNVFYVLFYGPVSRGDPLSSIDFSEYLDKLESEIKVWISLNSENCKIDSLERLAPEETEKLAKLANLPIGSRKEAESELSETPLGQRPDLEEIIEKVGQEIGPENPYLKAISRTVRARKTGIKPRGPYFSS